MLEVRNLEFLAMAGVVSSLLLILMLGLLLLQAAAGGCAAAPHAIWCEQQETWRPLIPPEHLTGSLIAFCAVRCTNWSRREADGSNSVQMVHVFFGAVRTAAQLRRRVRALAAGRRRRRRPRRPRRQLLVARLAEGERVDVERSPGCGTGMIVRQQWAHRL